VARTSYQSPPPPQPEPIWVAAPPRAAYVMDTSSPGAAMLSILQILSLILDVVWFLVIAHVILSWLIQFQILNLRQPLVAQIWDGLNRLLEPIYSRIRSVLPNMGGLDLAPLVLLLGLYAIRIVIQNNLHLFV
jgi:YggT family protein